MIYPSFLLGNSASLAMKLMNSVVVVGLYYGFLTTLSIGPSYLLLLQAHFQVIEEGEEEAIEKEVAASTGFMIGQLLMFISIYYRPPRLVLSRPRTITFITVPYLYLHYMWYSYEDFFVDEKSTRKNSMRTRNLSIQCIFLNNLFFQLLSHFFFFPSTMFFRLLNVYMFRYNNKILFLTSSFVSWLIGHILFMKSVRFVLVWIQQNYLVRSNKPARPKKYLFYVFRFYQNLIFDLRNSFGLIGGILVFFTCLLIFNKMPLPILTYKPKEAEVEIDRKKAEEYFYRIGLAKEGEFTKEEPSPPLFKLFKVFKVFKEAFYKKIPTSDQNDGKKRISFSHPPSLAAFSGMIQKKTSLSTTEKLSSDELYNYGIRTNEQKKNSLSTEFSKEIAVLDRKGLKEINVLEKKTRLADKKKDKIQYFQKTSDPLLRGSSWGHPKKPPAPTPFKRLTDLFFLPPEAQLIKNNERYLEKCRPDAIIIAEFRYFMSFINDSLAQSKGFHQNFIEREGKIKEIEKKTLFWPSSLLKNIQQLRKQEKDAVLVEADIAGLPCRRATVLLSGGESDTDEKESKKLHFKRYVPRSQFRRELIKGSMRVQKCKTSVWSIYLEKPHSRFFTNRIDSLFYTFLKYCEFIRGIFLEYTGKISEFERLVYYSSFEDVLLTIEELENEPTEREKIDEQIMEAERAWEEEYTYGQPLRAALLGAQAILRKYIIFPLLIVAKNIGRMLLLQRPEWSQDFKEWKNEVYIKCTYNGIPFSTEKLPEYWSEDGFQIMAVSPFRLKPWHDGYRPFDRDPYQVVNKFDSYDEVGPTEKKGFFNNIKQSCKKIRFDERARQVFARIRYLFERARYLFERARQRAYPFRKKYNIKKLRKNKLRESYKKHQELYKKGLYIKLWESYKKLWESHKKLWELHKGEFYDKFQELYNKFQELYKILQELYNDFQEFDNKSKEASKKLRELYKKIEKKS